MPQVITCSYAPQMAAKSDVITCSYASEMAAKCDVLTMPVLVKDEKKYSECVHILYYLEKWTKENYSLFIRV